MDLLFNLYRSLLLFLPLRLDHFGGLQLA